VEEGDVVCTIDSPQIRSEYEQIVISLENAEVGLNKTKADLNMQFALLEAQVRTNEADTKIAQMDSLQLEFVSSTQRMVKELELERATIQKERYEKKIEALRVIQQSEIRKLEIEIQQLRVRVVAVKEVVDALTIKAPRRGLLILANNTSGQKLQLGDNLWYGRPVATLPDVKAMKVKIMASESDFRNISVNDSVNYTFDAMPGNTGTGKILRKTPVGQPYKRGSNVKFFEIEASIDSVTSMPEPGFTANCHIILKQEKNVISVPQIAVFDEDSIRVVFVQNKKGFEKRQVLTGLSSTKEAVITAGLSEGEEITLSKPKISLIKDWIALPDSLTKKPETPVKEEIIISGLTKQ
jgi:multidrug efflux pump subunit AcrA (membrane-fusion protein)